MTLGPECVSRTTILCSILFVSSLFRRVRPDPSVLPTPPVGFSPVSSRFYFRGVSGSPMYGVWKSSSKVLGTRCLKNKKPGLPIFNSEDLSSEGRIDWDLLRGFRHSYKTCFCYLMTKQVKGMRRVSPTTSTPPGPSPDPSPPLISPLVYNVYVY